MSPVDESKLALPAGKLEKLLGKPTAAVSELLARDVPAANVVGAGVGVKWSGGQPTGKAAVIVFVTHKMAEEELPDEDRVPQTLQGTPTDVLAVGELFAGRDIPPAASVAPQTLARRLRPAEGGYSVGHFRISAGTIATCVYDILEGGGVTPPVAGVGIPRAYYILSNNHVLADSNAAALGDPILQPGPFDGGTDPTDRIARLSRFVPITFDPPVPRPLHRNLVDAAVAQGEFHDLDREIYWTGYVRGWRPRRRIEVGNVVQKTGRTTNYTLGRVVAVNAVVDVNYGAGRVARFQDQIITTAMSAGGDSGSLVTTLDDVAVGLLFAGSSQATILNQIENVRALLRVEVAEEVL